MNPIITAFESSPDRGQGLARDMRVRWAFEEVGQPYEVRLLSFAAMKEPAHLAHQPFGQIPTYEEGDLTLFESGAILLHIAEQHSGLLTSEPDARGRGISWMFAALNTVEPPIVDRSMAMMVEADKSWHEERLRMIDQQIRVRLGQLSAHLGGSPWLDGDFSAGDLLMVSVLLRLGSPSPLEDFPTLIAYRKRGEARPAYQRAFEAQLKVFRSHHWASDT